MTTKQTRLTVAMTDEQTTSGTDGRLDAVVGGAAYIRDAGVQGGVQQRLSNTR